MSQSPVAHGVKAFEKTIFNPGTLVRTWGTRPGVWAWLFAPKFFPDQAAGFG